MCQSRVLPHRLPSQTSHGFALVVALVLLLVMTLVAVIAMRSTTLDLKMTSNNALSRRAFQSSESLRETMGPMLASLSFYGGWPTSLGGTVADNNFNGTDTTSNYIPTLMSTYHVTMSDATKIPATDGYTLANLNDSTNPRSSTSDLALSVIGQEDLKTAIWVTKTGTIKGGPRVPGAGVGNYIFEIYNVQSRGHSAGGAEIRTESEFRMYINTVGSH